MILGVDVGGVIIDRAANDNSDTSLFGDNYLSAKAMEHVFEALRRLNGWAFKDRVWVVSKCGSKIERRTREWLRHNRFHEETGIPEARLVFVRRREDKAPEAKRIGLTHFVDDRLEVLSHMTAIVPHRVLFRPSAKEISQFKEHIAGVHIADDWLNLAAWLEETVRPAGRTEGHGHGPGEFCDGCRPVLQADYGIGEQFWRHWASAWAPYIDGRDARFKILSKKTKLAQSTVYEFVCTREFKGGVRETFGQGYFEKDEQLVGFAKGVELALQSVVRHDRLVLEAIDFRACDTLEKYQYKLREGTTFKVWEGGPAPPEP